MDEHGYRYDDDLHESWVNQRLKRRHETPDRPALVWVLIVAVGVLLGNLLGDLARWGFARWQDWPSLQELLNPPTPATQPGAPPPVVPPATSTLPQRAAPPAPQDFRQQTEQDCRFWEERLARDPSPLNEQMRDRVCGLLEQLR